MESMLDILDCKKLLDDLESATNIDDDAKFLRLSWIYEHLPIQVAPRLQRDFDACLSRSPEILSNLFEKVDLSNKALLNSLFKLFLSYGCYKISLTTYYIETTHDEFFVDSRFTPEVVDAECYDLTPLLPRPSEGSSLSWEHLMISSLIVDEPELFHTSFRLLIQKLHLHAILLNLRRYNESIDTIKASGSCVAEKICEKICDFAHDDLELMTIDSFLLNLLIPFTNADQQEAIVEALLLARFKVRIISDPVVKSSNAIERLNNTISNYVMNISSLQEVLVRKLIEHLKCNTIRRKRRHSVEVSENEAEHSLESCLSSILAGHEATETNVTSPEVRIKAKRLQKLYLTEWVEFVSSIITGNNLNPKSSIMLLQTCSVLLISVSSIIEEDLTDKISILMTKTIDNTNPRWSNQLFKTCGIEYLIGLTRTLSEQTKLLDSFHTPMRRFFSAYLIKYLRVNLILRNPQEFVSFITFVCDNEIGKEKSHILEYIIVKELAGFADDIGVKGCNKTLSQFLEHNKSLSKNLYKFIKRNLKSRDDKTDYGENSPEKSLISNGTNGQNDHMTRTVAMDALVSILKVAIEKMQQDTLDLYGELLLKLYNLMCARIQELIQIMRTGTESCVLPIDIHLPRLMKLYIDNQTVIEPYLCYELNQKVSSFMTKVKDLNDAERLNANLLRRDDYSEIKTKLDVVRARGNDSDLVYQTLINRQYKQVVDQAITQDDFIKRERNCCDSHKKHMQILLDLNHVVFSNCSQSMYDDTLRRVVSELEDCDALDHPTVLYLILMIESLIPSHSKDENGENLFMKTVPRVSCCLIRISKLVELGPSIHSFTNAGSHRSAGAIQCCTYSNCINLFTLIFRRYPSKLSNHFIADAMQVCVNSDLARYAKYSSKLHQLFIQLATSIASLLKSISMGRKQGDALKSSMPIFLSVFTTLVRCIILASDKQELLELPQLNGHGNYSSIDESQVEQSEEVSRVYDMKLEHLAHDIGRLMNNLSFLETRLVDYAPHVISTYVKDTQRAPCPEFIKKHLDEGVYRIFNLVDAYQGERREEIIESASQRKTLAGRAGGSLLDMIYTRLDQASREIFRNMHDNYNRFHRYQGKC